MSEKEVAVSEEPTVETAFIIYKDFDGVYHATPTLDVSFVVDRLATRTDMKLAFSDLLEAIKAEQLADVIIYKINNKSNEDSQRKADAIRQNLLNRE
jgi:hypothetical protein